MAEIYRSTSVSGSRRLHDKDNGAAKTIAEDDVIEPEASSAIASKITSSLASGSLNSPGEPEAAEDGANALRDQIKLLQDDLERTRSELHQYQQRESLIEKQSRDKGFKRGFEEGEKEALMLYREKMDAFSAAMSVFDSRLADDIARLERDAAELGYEALLRIVGEHYEKPAFLKAMVDAAIEKIRDSKCATVHVSPCQIDCIEEAVCNGEIQNPHQLKFIADHRVKLGGCIIETRVGSWDGRLEAQLERLKEALVNAERERR